MGASGTYCGWDATIGVVEISPDTPIPDCICAPHSGSNCQTNNIVWESDPDVTLLLGILGLSEDS